MTNQQRGFTIIEIAIAIAVLGTVTVIFVMKMSGGMQKAKKSEAQLQLHNAERKLKEYYVQHSAFPVGTSAPVPARPCCESPEGRCSVVAASEWSAQPGWGEIGFHIDEPTRFQYTYSGTASSATVTATGDPECDNPGKKMVLHLTTEVGNVRASVEE